MKKILSLFSVCLFLCSCQQRAIIDSKPNDNTSDEVAAPLIAQEENPLEKEVEDQKEAVVKEETTEGKEEEKAPSQQDQEEEKEEKELYPFVETEITAGYPTFCIFPTVIQFPSTPLKENDKIEFTYMFGMDYMYNNPRYHYFRTSDSRKNPPKESDSHAILSEEYEYVTVESYFENTAGKRFPLIDNVNTTKGGYDVMKEYKDSQYIYWFEYKTTISLSYSDFIRHEDRKDNFLDYRSYVNLSHTGERLNIHLGGILYDFNDKDELILQFGKDHISLDIDGANPNI